MRCAMRHRRKKVRRIESQQMIAVSLRRELDGINAKSDEDLIGLRDMLDKEFSKLEPEDRDIVYRILVCGTSAVDVGKELGIPDATVRGRVMRIRRNLRESDIL